MLNFADSRSALDTVINTEAVNPAEAQSLNGFMAAPKEVVVPEEASYGSAQRTLAQKVCFSGVAVHSGKVAHLTVQPAIADTGIVFVTARETEIPANISHVLLNDLGLSTLIATGDEVISTIEHLMAAFAACGIDNARIVIEGDELPILDGSAQPFIDKILDAGLVMQDAKRKFLRITKEFTYHGSDGQWLRFTPLVEGEVATLSVDIDFEGKIDLIGKQSLRMAMQPLALRREIMHCRTFGLESDALMLQKKKLVLGGSLDNAVIYSEDSVLNPEGLRCADESVRHKALDMIGDLYLAGWPLLGHIAGFKPSHRLNAEALQALFRSDCFEI